MIKLIKKILGIDRLEKEVDFLLTAHEGSRNIIALIFKILNIPPEKFVELIRFNPHELINYNQEVIRLMDEIPIDEVEDKMKEIEKGIKQKSVDKSINKSINKSTDKSKDKK